ncbi:hypothetical protein PCE1_001981 [Barthelona sp. PCE]
MPRIRSKIHSNKGVIHCSPSYCIFEPIKPNDEIERSNINTFMVAADFERRIKLPVNEMKLYKSCHNCVYETGNNTVAFFNFNGSGFEEMGRISISSFFGCEFSKSTVTVLSEDILIMNISRRTYIANISQNECIEYPDVRLWCKLSRITVLVSEQKKYMIPMLGSDGKVDMVYLPFQTNIDIAIEVVNSENPTCFFGISSKLYLVSIFERNAEVIDYQIDVWFNRMNSPKEAISSMIAFRRLDDGKILRSIEVSNSHFRRFLCFEGIVFGVYSDYIYPFIVLHNIDGFAIIPNMPFGLSDTNTICRMPMFSSTQHSAHFDIFSNFGPRAIIHVVDEKKSCNMLVNVKVCINDGELTVLRLLYGDDRCSTFLGDDCLAKVSMTIDDHAIHSDLLTFTSNGVVRISQKFENNMYINNSVIKVPYQAEDWFDATIVDNIIWVGGSNCTGIVVLNQCGNVVDFQTIETSVPFMVPNPNPYNPYSALIASSRLVALLYYDMESKKFREKIVEENFNVGQKFFFINETMFIIGNQLFEFTEGSVNLVNNQLPWVCFNSLEFYYYSASKNTISRLHMRLKGYDMVVDVLTLDGSHCYSIDENRCNVVTLLSECNELFTISSIRDDLIKETSLYHNYHHHF